MYFRWREVERELAEYKLREKGDPCQLEYQAQQFSQVIQAKKAKGRHNRLMYVHQVYAFVCVSYVSLIYSSKVYFS